MKVGILGLGTVGGGVVNVLQKNSSSYFYPVKQYDFWINNKDEIIFNFEKKIIENAFTFEAWNNEKLIGLVAAYINPNETAFITNVSVLKKYSNAGIAKVLITMCIKKAVTMKIAQIDLEVNKSSVNAIKLYKKIGLMKINEDKTTIKMSYRIRDK